MSPKLQGIIQKWIDDQYKASVTSIAALTPPSRRADSKSKSSAGARAKEQIKKLKGKIMKSFTGQIAYGVPLGGDMLREEGGSSYVHTYVLKKGRGRRAKMPESSIPTFSTPEGLVSWYVKHSKYSESKRIRIVNADAHAFVTSATILKRAAQIIANNAGVFIASWYSLFDKYHAKLSKVTTSHAITTARMRGSSTIEEDKNYGMIVYNEGNSAKGIQRYTERIIEQEYPATLKYECKKNKKYLEMALQKELNMEKKQAREVAALIKIHL